jgi:hypothetical protein
MLLGIIQYLHFGEIDTFLNSILQRVCNPIVTGQIAAGTWQDYQTDSLFASLAILLILPVSIIGRGRHIFLLKRRSLINYTGTAHDKLFRSWRRYGRFCSPWAISQILLLWCAHTREDVAMFLEKNRWIWQEEWPMFIEYRWFYEAEESELREYHQWAWGSESDSDSD